ncbi:MAG TPA: signal recognition particle-docking protein FtsY [Polyangiaceae bacterium]|nr:signal recognition particle-docking protein FtsY [Polyangiaceae bacterium]
METYLLIAIIVVALIYFLFFRGRVGGERAARDANVAGRVGAGRAEARRAAEPAPRKTTPQPATVGADEEEVVPESMDLAEARKPATPERPQSQPPPPNRASKRPGAPDTLSRGPDVQTLRRGLGRSRDSGGVFGRLKALLGGERQLDAEIAQQIEEVLLASDVGAATTQAMLTRIRDGLDRGELTNSDAVWRALRQEAVRMLSIDGRAGGAIEVRQSPMVVLFVGVNGAGKTTTIGKLATQLKATGKTCVLAAGDTFRAAAVQQLVIWGKRVGCEVVHGKDGADPGSVLFEAIKKAEEIGADIVLADTAGRLHTKANLMQEMQKISRSAAKAASGAPHETFLVIDATNGQNALAQAREFKEALDVTGIVLTKLDGTAKGGVVLGISDSLRVPVRFVGMGEGPDDLHEFVPQRFVDALLGDEQAA